MIYIHINTATRLGNWMFQYAAARSRCRDVAFCGNVAYIKSLASKYGNLFKDVPIVDEKVVHGVDVYKAPDVKYVPIPEFAGDVVFEGYFQSEKYFNKELIQQLFAPSAEMVRRLRAKYGGWLGSSGVTGISIRRGRDYLRIPDRHPFVGLKYFKTAIGMFPSDTRFIVCSDDIGWCKKVFKGERFCFVEGESVLAQLYIHSLCNNNIISNSSFSWWGAWLNANPNKRVIAPRTWFGMSARIDASDIYWDGMELVENRLSCGLWLRAAFNTVCLNLHRDFPKFYQLYSKVRWNK